MKRPLSDVFRVRWHRLRRSIVRNSGLLVRALICWGIGCLALTADEVHSFDNRFGIRGDQKASSDIVVITLLPSDFSRAYDIRTRAFTQAAEITDVTDSFFWDRRTWSEMLEVLLADNPRAVGVTLWFGDNIGAIKLTEEERLILQDPRVIWSTSVNNMERTVNPSFALPNLSNIATSDLRRDDDGVVRRVFATNSRVPLLVEKLSHKNLPSSASGSIINYRGPARLFTHYTLSDLFSDRIPKGALTGKIILIGADSGNGPRYNTPLGPMDRADLIAQVLDNQLENRWIRRPPAAILALAMLALTLWAVFLITTYPQSVALLFFLWTGTFCAALSAWGFDNFFLWTPAYSPFAVLIAIWLVFAGYQTMRIERLNAELQQEQKSAHELEQLKNNFVSLISHDLKTPIAKIQAVVDRLRTQNVSPGLEPDLKSLHDFSDELNRYIQSILKVLRVESRDFRLNREVADINEVIEQAVTQLRPLAEEKNLTVKTELEPMFSSEFDVTLIKEVVINLVENAIKYTPAGGRVDIRSTEVDNEIQVDVQDTGQGISPEDIHEVWGKFARGREQDLKSKGSGLGLYLVKYFIELHGGTVNLQSELGRGSTVSFTLPLVDDTKSANEDLT